MARSLRLNSLKCLGLITFQPDSLIARCLILIHYELDEEELRLTRNKFEMKILREIFTHKKIA
jgi:hypothetical protein